jgi:hypothetical protein
VPVTASIVYSEYDTIVSAKRNSVLIVGVLEYGTRPRRLTSIGMSVSRIPRKRKHIFCDLCNLICKDWGALFERLETSIHSDHRASRKENIANIDRILAKGIRIPSNLLYREEGANNTVTAFEAAFTEEEPVGTHTPSSPPSRKN